MSYILSFIMALMSLDVRCLSCRELVVVVVVCGNHLDWTETKVLLSGSTLITQRISNLDFVFQFDSKLYLI